MPETIRGYDEIPYESFPITETHPDRLAAIGQLFGLKAPDPRRARVLELGCAAGGNLLPVAWFLPESRCVGIELSREQALRGKSLAEAMDLNNLTLEHRDILDFPLAGEAFDYIVAHGVFSWVPENVREHILALCGSRLAPGGIAYISYNTLPGGRQRAMLRDMFLHHLRGRESPRERLSGARELLDFLATPLEKTPAGHEWLQQELQYLRSARDSYLYHEYLEDRNDPLLFADFVAAASRHGLQYLADSQLHTLFPSTLGPAAEQALSRFDDLVCEQQYADFLRLRPFRQSLLCRSNDPLDRDIDLDTLLSLPLYADLVPARNGPRFRNAAGQEFRVDDPLTRAVLGVLAAATPRALTLTEAWPQAVASLSAKQRARATDGIPATLASALFNLFVSGGVQVTRIGSEAWRREVPVGSSGPCASRLARTLAQRGEALIPTPRHQALELDRVSRRMVVLLDGTRNAPQIVDALLSEAASDADWARSLGGGPPERLLPKLRTSLDRLLRLLAHHGLVKMP
ncbi:Methyltransferase [Thioalkalivibrio nitratireducens DSM 14787]|uniref:Methyltransferase n=1 Tax=Thioalkalivibrio nitratireducens (strain DSM 14787 / UNIQEM 213 / ALEN2) TaxID=1255043 RepID=L0DXS2_THIND|nr:class I SAM-dependent methyltransferase [Thioalkalivibrio nitratireducens]AGA33843.1 Methyltransferase [Thioalkalivibrio nitratireducens DSM 14787]